MIQKNYILRMMLHLNKTIIFKNVVYDKNILRLCSSVANENLEEWKKIKSNYTDSVLKSVLRTLNKCDATDMQNKYGIAENNIKKLILYKNENKNFKSLDDLVLHNLINVPQLEDICTSIITKKSTKSKKAGKINPAIKEGKLKDIKTALGLRIGTNFVSWTHLELTGSSCEVLKLDSRTISDLSFQANMTDIIKMGISIASAIPEADAYVMEKESPRPMTNLNLLQYRISVRQQQINSIILTKLLSNGCKISNNESSDNNVHLKPFYTLRQATTSQIFELFHGHETVSSRDVVEAIFENRYDGLNNISSVIVNNEIIKQYHLVDTIYNKEELNRSLLLILSFFETALDTR